MLPEVPSTCAGKLINRLNCRNTMGVVNYLYVFAGTLDLLNYGRDEPSHYLK